jgi:hypothetical protein
MMIFRRPSFRTGATHPERGGRRIPSFDHRSSLRCNPMTQTPVVEPPFSCPRSNPCSSIHGGHASDTSPSPLVAGQIPYADPTPPRPDERTLSPCPRPSTLCRSQLAAPRTRLHLPRAEAKMASWSPVRGTSARDPHSSCPGPRNRRRPNPAPFWTRLTHPRRRPAHRRPTHAADVGAVGDLKLVSRINHQLQAQDASILDTPYLPTTRALVEPSPNSRVPVSWVAFDLVSPGSTSGRGPMSNPARDTQVCGRPGSV